MLQTTPSVMDRIAPELIARETNRLEQPDHAFPRLSAGKLAFPPEFRFMWAKR